MKTLLFVIYDSKAEVYGKPFHLLNQSVAMRTALDLRSDKTTEIARHPEDFTMFHIGEYDDSTGQVTQMKSMDVVCRFHEIQPQLFDELDEHHINPVAEAS